MRERLRRIRETRLAAEAALKRRREHEPFFLPDLADVDALATRFQSRGYGGLRITNVERVRVPEGVAFLAIAVDPRTGDRVPVRGFEIRIRQEHPREIRPGGVRTLLPNGAYEDSYVFWGNARKLDRYRPAQTYEEVVSPPEAAGVPRPRGEDMITVWRPRRRRAA